VGFTISKGFKLHEDTGNLEVRLLVDEVLEDPGFHKYITPLLNGKTYTLRELWKLDEKYKKCGSALVGTVREHELDEPVQFASYPTEKPGYDVFATRQEAEAEIERILK